MFTGKGAVLARDVEYALREIRVEYEKIGSIRIKEGKLREFSCLIIPGGYTETIVDDLTTKGLNEICEFVKSGGGYIGICAGAYIAADKVEIHPAYKRGKPKGLGIINIKNIRKEGIGIRSIKITNLTHPIAKDCSTDVKIWYQNGPFIVPDKDVEVIAQYDTEHAAIVCARYVEGRVVIFSPHPEGSITWGIKPHTLGTLELLKNACEWVIGDTLKEGSIYDLRDKHNQAIEE